MKKHRVWKGLAAFMLVSTLSGHAFAERILRQNEASPGILDPHIAADNSATTLMINLYDTLVTFAPGGELVPSLAKSWEIDSSGLEYRFTLNPEAKFPSGDPVTATDVVYSLNRIKAIKRGFSFLFEPVDGARAEGAETVAFTLKHPYAPFVGNLARLSIISEAAAQANKVDGPFGEFGDYAQAYLSQHSAGSGPYVAASHAPQEETTLRKNEEYFRGFAPKAPDLVRIRYGVDAATVRTLLARKELDISRPPLTTEILSALTRTDDVKLGQDRTLALFTYKLNTQRAPTDDPEFRKAIALGFDYEAMDQLLTIGDVKLGFPARGPLSSLAMGFDPDLPTQRRDIEAARAALTASKYAPDEYTLDLLRIPEAPQQEKYALLFQQNMSELGIKVNIITAPWAQLVQLGQAPETTPHVTSVYPGLQTPDPDSQFWPQFHSSAAGTFASMEWYHTPELDAQLEEGRRITDPSEREAFYRNLSQEVFDLHTSLYVYERAAAIPMRRTISAPSSENPDLRVPLLSGNFQFRMMEVDDE